MTHHIILWKLKDGFSDSRKAEIEKNIKDGLVRPFIEGRYCFDYKD